MPLAVASARAEKAAAQPSSPPEIEVIVHPPVYDPERYNRALEILARVYERAMMRHLRALQAAKEPQE